MKDKFKFANISPNFSALLHTFTLRTIQIMKTGAWELLNESTVQM